MNEYRITKYDPSFRDRAGAYTRDEWISVRDIGRSFAGVMLTREEYERVEGAYAEVAMAFLREAGVSALRVEGLENQRGHVLNFREGSLLPVELVGFGFPPGRFGPHSGNAVSLGLLRMLFLNGTGMDDLHNVQATFAGSLIAFIEGNSGNGALVA